MRLTSFEIDSPMCLAPSAPILLSLITRMRRKIESEGEYWRMGGLWVGVHIRRDEQIGRKDSVNNRKIL